MSKTDFKKLGSSSEFRSAPFWAWNGKMKPEEVRRQINVMNEMGMGGFFMHSRMGLRTEYMSEEWFDAIKAGIDEAAKLNMKANLYDEDRWPSGAAGGFVTADHRLRIRYLELYRADDPIPGLEEDLLQCSYFAIRKESDSMISEYRAADKDEKLPEGWSLIKIAIRIAEDQPGFNNAAYLDTMNPEAVQEFIDFTYEKYFEECGKDFGKTVPYFFTDEPNYLDKVDYPRRPWSERLPELFKAQMNEDINNFLPEFFFHTPERFSAARYTYYRILNQLFVNTFMKMVGQWCEKHNIEFTGHVLLEDTLSRQALAVGAAMPCYEYMQMPGIDLLTETWFIFNAVKQVASVARQLGKKRFLSETYGCTGWDFPLSGHKALGDWQYALGVNYRCQHLSLYTMRGEAKRDYPASISGQSPWYTVYKPMEDYFGRLSELLSQAESTAELLVLHPMESMWGCAGYFPKSTLSYDEALDRIFDELGNTLIANHIEFDFGDESLMAKYGRVEAEKLLVGKAAYRRVYLPEVLTLRRTTMELLEKFVQAGGKVFFSGNVPQCIDGKKDESGVLNTLYSKFEQIGLDKFADMMVEKVNTYSIADGKSEIAEIIACEKVIDNRSRLLFAANMGTRVGQKEILEAPLVLERQSGFEQVNWSLRAGEADTVRELDIYSGELYEVDFTCNGEYFCWQSDMAPLQSRCYIAGRASELSALSREKSVPVKDIVLTEQPAEFSEKNLLVLDKADLFINGRNAAENKYILELDKLVRHELGLAPRGGAELQPWKIVPSQAPGVDIELVYKFDCQAIPGGELQIILESPELFEIELNGVVQNNHSDGFWCDPALEKVRIEKADLRCGENILKLRSNYKIGFAGLEAVYLYGDFGVNAPDTITALPQVYSGSSITEQQMPFYSGNIFYNYTFELEESARCRVESNVWQGCALAVSFDGEADIPLYSQPYCVDSPVLAAGKHTLRITVFGHRRNAFGPFYWQRNHNWVGPYEYQQMDVEEKILVELGLTGKAKLLLIK